MKIAALVLALAPIAAVPAANDQSAPVTVIKGAALVITMDPALGSGPLGVVNGAAVTFAGDKIVSIGAPPAHADTVIDANGLIVMPGFVDVHNHLWQSVIRGCGLDADLHGWLERCMWGVVASLTEADAYALVRLSTLDLIDTGVTTTVDWSIAPSREMVAGDIRALAESGLRFVFAYFDWHCTAEDCTRAPQTRRDIIEFKRRHIDPNPLARLHTAAHPIPYLAPSIRNMAALARELGIPFNVHYLENKKDPHGAINGISPGMTELLAEANAFDGELIVNHAVHVTDAEIARLARHGARVAHNPLSNMRLASGVMPLPRMQRAGLKIGLGFDGGTNDTTDVFNLMRVAVGLQRAQHLDAGVYPGVADVLRMATLGGAEVLGLDRLVGSLTPGKQADLILLDPHEVNFAPDWSWVDQIVFNGQPRNVKAVWVAGKLLKSQGRVHADTAAAVRAAEAATAAIKARLGR